MNRLREAAKKISWIRKGYAAVRRRVFAAATVVSPTLNTKLRYRSTHGKKLDLAKPESFHEKLLWLKLNRYMKDPLVIQCADKYLVRDYVRQCGCADILNDLLGCWDHAKQIEWDTLPEKFVLKWNFGAGFNYVCTNKAALDKDTVVKQFDQWEQNKCWLGYAEMHYKYIPRKIICEAFLEDHKSGGLPDYKVYCFHGVPQAILVMHDRGKKMKTEFFDTAWTKLENTSKYEETATETEKPACLEQMLQAAAKLSQPFPFVRCDFYVVDGKLYFGELTFTPAAGIYTSETSIHGTSMADLIHLEKDLPQRRSL